MEIDTSGSLDIKLYRMAGLGKVGTVVQHEHRLVTVRKTHPCLGTKQKEILLGVLWIRIEMRIRIQHFRSMRIWIRIRIDFRIRNQGFDDQKIVRFCT
jgi:hypothetical protein